MKKIQLISTIVLVLCITLSLFAVSTFAETTDKVYVEVDLVQYISDDWASRIATDIKFPETLDGVSSVEIALFSGETKLVAVNLQEVHLPEFSAVALLTCPIFTDGNSDIEYWRQQEWTPNVNLPPDKIVATVVHNGEEYKSEKSINFDDWATFVGVSSDPLPAPVEEAPAPVEEAPAPVETPKSNPVTSDITLVYSLLAIISASGIGLISRKVH